MNTGVEEAKMFKLCILYCALFTLRDTVDGKMFSRNFDCK